MSYNPINKIHEELLWELQHEIEDAISDLIREKLQSSEYPFKMGDILDVAIDENVFRNGSIGEVINKTFDGGEK